MSAPLCQAACAELPQLLLGLAGGGFRGAITAHVLSSLVAHAKDHSVPIVLSWIEDDPRLLLMPSWQFIPYFCFMRERGRF